MTVIYLDFTKVFDKDVYKLGNLGIVGKLKMQIMGDVPKGKDLGPLLFIYTLSGMI